MFTNFFLRKFIAILINILTMDGNNATKAMSMRVLSILVHHASQIPKQILLPTYIETIMEQMIISKQNPYSVNQ